MKRKILKSGFFSIMILTIALTACAQGTPQVTSEQTESPIVTESTASEDTAIPETATSVSQSRVILTASPESDQEIVRNVQATLDNLVSGSGFSLEMIENLSPAEISTGAKVVIGVGPNIDFVSLASQFSETQFVAIDAADIVPANNLSVIGGPLVDTERLTFMAGYLSALISTDYKAAGLFPSNNEHSEEMINSFVVGVRFFCGICQPKYPPYNSFPQWQTLPAENTAGGFETTLDLLISSGTEILFVQKELLSPEIINYLSDFNIKVISDGHPDGIPDFWAGTLKKDPTPVLNIIWSDVIAGTGGFQEPSSILLTDIDAGLISEGRYQIFEEMLSDLDAGIISIEPSP